MKGFPVVSIVTGWFYVRIMVEDRSANTTGAAAARNERPVLAECRGMGKRFVTDEVETVALMEIDLSIRENDFIVIHGPSGCGKSTLLSILAMFDTPTVGTYHLKGKPTNELGLDERARLRNEQIGYVFQSFNLLGHLTVFQNVELPLTWRGMKAGERKERVVSVLERVGLSHRVKHYPSQLSGGQQQRVAVARAVAGSPAFILADEPTGNLDSKNAEGIMELLHQLHKGGATLIMVTHQLGFGAQATRWVHLNDGRVVSAKEQAPELTAGATGRQPLK
jgi:putative ABC transport system ATP-binding protein